MTFDPIRKILGDRISKNKDMPVTEIAGYSQKELQRAYAKKWRTEHPEEDKEKKRLYHQRHLERQRQKFREYAKEHSAEAVARAKKWNIEHIERYRANTRRRSAKERALYPERVAERRRRFREKLKRRQVRSMIDYV